MEYTNEIQVTYLPVFDKALKISSSLDAYEIFKPYFPTDSIALQERMVAMFLNHANCMVGIRTICIGDVSQTLADGRLILALALKTLASGIILAHNHPSGNLTPSKPDILTTQQIKTVAEMVHIKVLDHLILSPEGLNVSNYYSFADNCNL